jgi:acetolactate synthase I/II/III large subunit
MATTTGGQIIARMLRAEGLEKFFGIVDGTYLQLCAHCVEEGIQMITPRHEAVAAHMAGAYARLTGKLGVCIASNGPGVANMLAGVAVENVEGNRVLLITSSRRTGITYPDRGGAYQCFDHVGVIKNMAKWSASCAYAERLPELLRRALRKCYQGRPGVVHLDVPESLINGPCAETPVLAPSQYRRTRPIAPPAEQVEQAADLLVRSKLAVIHAGSGIIHAQAFSELQQAAERLHAPITTSWAGRGVIDERHPLVWPMIHIDATAAVRNAADVCLCLGSDIGETDWWGKPPYWAKPADQAFIQVDIDEDRLARNRPNDLAVIGDVRVFLQMLVEQLDSRADRIDMPARRAAVAELAKQKTADRDTLDQMLSAPSQPMISCHVPHVCRQLFGDDAIVIFDGGNTAVWGNFYTQLRAPNTQLGTHHMGHLGAGVGQALGAAAAQPDRQVYCLIGDGAMGFNMQEIETAVRCGLNVVFLVFVDRAWGMVKINQMFALQAVKQNFKTALGPDHNGTINTDLGEIAWDQLARSMGAFGARADSPETLREALAKSRRAGTCAVIHCQVNAEAHMMAPGLMHFKAMHQEPGS